jgi:threonine dehydratase
MNEASRLPTFDDVVAAQARIANDVVRTPAVRSDALDEFVRARVFIKAECLQRSGAFKVRGAFNRLRQINCADFPGGVITYSSGNHGQAVALAAKRLGMPATILMPSNSVRTKVELTRGHGAEVIFYDRAKEDAAAIGATLADKKRATIVPPANHGDVIAGQGTAALEMLEQIESLGGDKPDMLLVPCGSGGLTAGCSLVFANKVPKAQVFAVEPENFDDTLRSLLSGTRVANTISSTTICDALSAKTPAPITFAINTSCNVKGLVVSDDEVRIAMAFAFRQLKLVLEPGGAAALAAVLSRKLQIQGKTVAVVCSGGNVETDVFADAIGRT